MEKKLVPEVRVISEAELSAAAVNRSVKSQQLQQCPRHNRAFSQQWLPGGHWTADNKRGSCGHQRQATT